MAFDPRNLGVLAYAAGFSLWQYRSTSDNASVVASPSHMDPVAAMLRPDDLCNPVIDIVVGQDHAKQLLLGLDVVGKDVGPGRHRHSRTDRRHFIHRCFPPVAPGSPRI
jgi:hypothetical protein